MLYIMKNFLGATMRSFSRSAFQCRPAKITDGFNQDAHGSVVMHMGNTKVLCTASVSHGLPKFLRDKKPQGWLTAEYSMLPGATCPRSDREATKGRQQGRTIEIQRLIGRSLRSCLNLRAIPGYTITIDCDVLQADGGTRSAAITGAYVAMVKAIQTLQYKGVFKKDPLIDSVTALSLGIVKGNLLVDLDYLEDLNADSDINLVLNSSMDIIEIQGTAESKPFSIQQLQQLVSQASDSISVLQSMQNEVIGNFSSV